MAEAWVRRIDGVRAERALHEGSEDLPLMLRSAVRGTVTPGRFRQPWSRRLILVKWALKGRAQMSVGGRRMPIAPGDVAVHIPTHPHQFWCLQEGTELCWFSVDGPLAEPFVHLLGLRAGVYPYGPAPLERVNEMIESFADQSVAGTRRSSLLAIHMLYDTAARIPRQATASIVQHVRHLIREGLADPELSAQRIARQLDYNRAAISRLFREQSGQTIMDAITQARLREAELLLGRTDARIGDVARQCGFRDGSYFTRWIKKHTGRMPSDLRVVGEPKDEMPR
jgi:AraC-like DNA-binding protein